MKTINEFLEEGRLGAIDTGQKDLRQITKRVLDALIAANDPVPVLFRHGGKLVWLEEDDQGRPILKEISQDRIRHLLARRFSWYRVTRNDGKRSAFPPPEVVRDLLASPNIGFPVVERIVSIPVFAPDGTIQFESGYNPATRCILKLSADLEDLPTISDEPDEGESSYALKLLFELLYNFPFVGAGRTHTIAALLVSFVRAMIKGPTPLHLFEKPEPGTGATLLVEALCDIILGRPVASITVPRSDDEFARKLHSVLRAGPSVVFMDNLKGRLDSSALSVALTNDSVGDRIVQSSDLEAGSVGCLWLAAGNNPTLSREIARRTIPIRLDAKIPNPHLRTNFLHPDLRQWVAKNRAMLIWSILTLIQAWIAAGRPKGDRKLGMYESYSEIIGGILQVAGVEGFLDIPAAQAELAEDEVDLKPLISVWRERFQFNPVTSAKLFPLCTDVGIDLGRAHEIDQKRTLGQLLRANRGRVILDVVIVPDGESGGSRLWRLAPADGGSSTPAPDDAESSPRGSGGVGGAYTPSKKKR